MPLFWNQSSLSEMNFGGARQRTPLHSGRSKNRVDLMAPAAWRVAAKCRQHQQYANHPGAQRNSAHRPMDVGPEGTQ
jgi:hypothetical protein